MADRTISELPAAQDINPADLFVLQQAADNSAHSLQGQVLIAFLTRMADGHGGIQSIVYTAPVPPSLTGSMLITLADGSSVSVPVTNGAKGDTGDQTYVWIKWAAQNPTADNQLSNNPDKWIGIYTGLSSTAPAAYTAYTWYEYKGEKGDQGDAVSSVVRTGGTGAPGTTDTYTMYVGEQSIGTFTVYNGLNGTGAVNTVNGISPDVDGNVELPPSVLGTEFAPGESLNLSGLQIASLVSSSGTSMTVFITLPKKLPASMTISPQITIEWVRGNGQGSTASAGTPVRVTDAMISIPVTLNSAISAAHVAVTYFTTLILTFN